MTRATIFSGPHAPGGGAADARYICRSRLFYSTESRFSSAARLDAPQPHVLL
jgi:hypothetical protein